MTLVVSNIRGGGAPYAVVNWANEWNAQGHDVTVLIIHPTEGAGNDFHLNGGIKVVRVDLMDTPVSNSLMAFRQVCRCLWTLRRYIQKSSPDVVMSFFEPLNVRVLMACFGLPLPVIVMEQTHPGQVTFGEFWEKWRKRVYPRAAALVNLTQNAAQWCADNLGIPNSVVIPNPVLPAPRIADLHHKGRKELLAAGRLVDQKGFDMLIDAFAKIAAEHPDWDLVIYGEGANRSDLEVQVQKAGLAERVRLPGWSNTISADMAKADMFVLSSRYEGFGNVVAEALATGLPVVSFDCISGPGEIVRHGVDGLLVPPEDVDALASSLSQVMGDDSMRINMGARAVEVLERFSIEQTTEKWDHLFVSLSLR